MASCSRRKAAWLETTWHPASGVRARWPYRASCPTFVAWGGYIKSLVFSRDRVDSCWHFLCLPHFLFSFYNSQFRDWVNITTSRVSPISFHELKTLKFLSCSVTHPVTLTRKCLPSIKICLAFQCTYCSLKTMLPLHSFGTPGSFPLFLTACKKYFKLKALYDVRILTHKVNSSCNMLVQEYQAIPIVKLD